MKRFKAAVVFIAAVLIASSVSAEKPAEIELGFKPDKVYSFGSLDNVNVFNGNLVFTVPIGPSYAVSSRFSYGLTLVYNSKAWDYWYEENSFRVGDIRAWSKPNIRSNAGIGWRVSLGRLIPPSDYTATTGYSDVDTLSWTYEGPAGDEHELGDSDTAQVVPSNDGSFLRMVLNADGKRQVQFPNGHVHTFAYERNAWRIKTMADASGNSATVTYTYVPNSDKTASWTITDPARVSCTVHFTSSALLSDTIDRGQVVDRITMRVNGTAPDVIYDFAYEDTLVDYSCKHEMPVDDPGFSGPSEPRPTVPMLSSVSLPDGSKWEFDYHTTNGGGCQSGLLSKVTLPTRGVMEYTYQLYTLPPNDRCAFDTTASSSSPGVKTRKADGAEWKYLLTRASPAYIYTGQEYHHTCNEPSPDGEQSPGVPRPTFRWTRTSVVGPSHDGSTHARTDHYFSVWRTAHLEVDEALNASDSNLFAYGFPGTAAWPGKSAAAATPVPYISVPDVTSADDATDPKVRYLREQTWTGCTADGNCSGTAPKLARSTYARNHDFNVAEWWVSTTRHPLSERVYFEDDQGCADDDLLVTCYAQTDYEDWDSWGHMRRVIESGNFKGASSATTETKYSGVAAPHSATQKWLTNLYTEKKRTVGTRKWRSLFHFSNDGLLERVRVLTNGATVSATDLLEVSLYTAGNLTTMRSYGGDAPEQALGTTSENLATLPLPVKPQYESQFTWQAGALETERPVDRAGADPVLLFKSRDYVRDNASGLVTSSRTPDGLSTGFTWTPWGTLSSVTPPGESTTSYVYTRATSAAPAKVTMTRGDVTVVYEYDGMGRLAREQRTLPGAGCVARTMSYDAFGRIRQESTWQSCTAPAAAITWQLFTYDAFGRTTSVRAPDGLTTSVAYTGTRLVERSVGITTPAGAATAKTLEEYDRFGRLISVTENADATNAEDRHVTSYEYDAGDRLTKVTMGTQTRAFNYDGRGFLTSEQQPELGGNSVRYREFDARGHARRRTIGLDNGPRDTRYEFDAAERLLGVTAVGAERVLELYAYDQSDELCPEVVCNGKLAASARFHYDTDLADTAAEESLAVTESYDYDAVSGRPVRRDRTIGNTTRYSGGRTFYFTQTWNDLGQPDTISYPCADAPLVCRPGGRTVAGHTYTKGLLTSVGQWASDITYSASGMVSTVKHGSNGTAGQEVWTADTFGLARPQKIEAKNSGGAVIWSSGAYAYDASGSITTIGTQTFAYDAMQRLVRWGDAVPGGASRWTSRSYDRFGNALHDTVGFCAPSGGPCAGTSTMTRPLTGTSNRYADTSYDAAGNVTSDVRGRSFVYDYANLMTRASVDGREYRYLYTTDGERIAAIERIGAGGAWQHRTTYTIRGFDNQLLSVWESAPSTNTLSWKEDEIRRGTTLLARESAANGTSHYFVDHLGSPRAVTTATGILRGVQNFDPFGNGGTADGGALQFTAHERDTATLGNGTTFLPDYMHARYYEPGEGRFLSVDPIFDVKRALRQPQMWNRYAYALNNPLRFIDPTGMLTYQATVLGVEVRVHIDDELDEKAQLTLKATIDASFAKINAGKEELTTQEQGIVTLIKSLEVGREDSGMNTQTGQLTMFAPHLMMQSSDAFAADYVHDSKHVFNANSLNPLYTNWFVGGRRQNIQELDERDASEFAVRIGAKIGLEPDALWKYQRTLIDSICNYQWWRDR